MYEDDTGLIYMRARYYSPTLRRFVNADKVHGDISNALSLNRYAFVNGNPASNVDPLGLSADNARGQVNYNGEWYDIYVPSPGMHFDAQWEPVKTVTVNDTDFNWAAFFAGIELDDYNGYLTGGNVNRKYVSKKEIYKMGACSAVGSILSGLDNLEGVYLDFVFEKCNDSKRVKILVGSSERTKHYNALADGYEHGVQLLYHDNPIFQGDLSDAIGQLYTALPDRKAKKWYQLYDMHITIDKRHAGERHFSYLSVDDNGALIETPIIYKNDKVEIGKTVFGYGMSDSISMPISAPSKLPDEFFVLFSKMASKGIYGIK